MEEARGEEEEGKEAEAEGGGEEDSKEGGGEREGVGEEGGE